MNCDSHFFRRQVEGFAAAVLHGEPLVGANVADGVAAVRVLAAIARSAQTGEAVDPSRIAGAV